MEVSFYMGIALFHAFILMTQGAVIRQIIDQHQDLVYVKNIMQKMVLPISELLEHTGPFTMFVPNNTAFAEGRLPPQQRSKLLSQGSTSTKEMVDNQFMYHIVNGAFMASDLQDSKRQSLAINAPYLFIRRMSDQELYVNGARIIRSDIKADNGYVHIIDTFLGVPLEPGDGVPLRDSAQGYIEQTGTQSTDLKRKTKKFNDLLDSYKSEFPNKATFILNNRETTVFVPSDESLQDFTTSDIANIKKDLTVLEGLVERHIIHTCSNPSSGECDKDNVYHSGILSNLAMQENSQQIQAMKGLISPTIFNNELYIGNECGGSKIVWGNITVKNGVIHMVDGFLGFRQYNVLQYLTGNRDFRTFADLAKGAPPYIDTELNKGSNDLDVPVGERITVFVPIETALRDYDLGNEEERELHIRYHVMKGEMEVKDMVNNTVKQMFPGNDQSDARITASFTQYENGDTYVTVDHVRARIIRPNICVKNGLVHVVDSILGVPLYSIYEYIEINTELVDLLQQLGYTGYSQELGSEVENKVYTFFAPVNRAIELLQTNKVGRKYLDPLNKNGASVLYGRHLTYGELYIDELRERVTDVRTYATATMGRNGNNFKIICNSGRPCHIEFEGRIMTFNQTDLKMTNGVIHLINEVIYTNDSAREAQLISSSPNHHISPLLVIMVTYALLLML